MLKRWTTYKVEAHEGKVYIPRVDGRLAVDKVERELVDRVIKGDTLSTARGICEVVDFGGLAFIGECLGCLHQVLHGFNDEGGAPELVLVRCLEAKHEWLCAITAEVCLLANLGSLSEAKVFGKPLGLVDVLVLIVDMGDAHQIDLLERSGRESGSHDVTVVRI